MKLFNQSIWAKECYKDNKRYDFNWVQFESGIHATPTCSNPSLLVPPECRLEGVVGVPCISIIHNKRVLGLQ